MTEACKPTQGPAEPRRRFLGFCAALLGGLGAVALARRVEPPAPVPRDLPLREADFYHPHDLAG
jgi:hypothetical protein